MQYCQTILMTVNQRVAGSSPAGGADNQAVMSFVS